MSHEIPAVDLTHDNRKIVVNGRKYYAMTANKCTTCSAERFMFLKQRHTGGSVTIECPYCDSYLTLREEMINYNLDK
jgi:DNA-directed RNA polymerase subunit RPC12/RpoP